VISEWRWRAGELIDRAQAGAAGVSAGAGHHSPRLPKHRAQREQTAIQWVKTPLTPPRPTAF